MPPNTGVRSGVLLGVIGLFLVLRTVNQDDSGRTLIDHILGKATNFNASSKASPANVGLVPLVPQAGATTPTTLTTTTPTGPAGAGAAAAQAIAEQINVTAAGVKVLPNGIRSIGGNRITVK